MRFVYTRPSKDAGWSWLREDKSPADNRYQFLVPLFQRLEVRRSAYYICTGDHKVLEIHKTDGRKVDERDNFICSVEDHSAKPDQEYGRRLILALLRRQGRFAVPEELLLSAMTYASRHLPARYAERLQISEEDFPGMMTADLMRRDVPEAEKVHADDTHWITFLPEFRENEERLADRLCRSNSGYIPEHMLEFFAYLNGAPFQAEWQQSFIRFFSGSADISYRLAERFIKDILPSVSDPIDIFRILRSYPPEQWKELWTAVSLRYLGNDPVPDESRDYDLYHKPVDSYSARFRMAVRSRIGLRMSLADAEPEELYRIYCDAADMNVPADLLRAILGSDDNSTSIFNLLASDSEDITGIVPAVLYLYGEITLRECVELYGDKQLARNMIDEVTERCLPPLLQRKALKKITALINKE